MADFYWVGGSGNWSAYATHWATTSGGSTFRTNAPTSADNVFFDDSSASGTFTVTIDTAGATCANFDASGIVSATKKMTLTGTASVGLLSVNGNWTNPSSTYFAWTSWTAAAVTFAATGTVITNSVTFSPIFTVNGSGITVTLGGALTLGGAFNLTNGTFDTSAANSYSFTASSITISANSNTRSLNLNGSSISLDANAAYTDSSTGGFTVNSGTSSITCSGSGVTFAGGGKTFYNVSISSTAIGTHTINGANSYNNLSFTAPTATGYRTIVLGANQTVTGTLTLGTTSSVSAIQRISLLPNVVRTQRTITMSGASSSIASVYDVDFRDIVIAKASGSTAAFPDDSSRTYRYGDRQNNSGITFSAGVSRYWNLAGSQNWSATAWATTNNGRPALENFPLPQDTATFTEAGSAGIVTFDQSWAIGSIQMADGVSNRITAFTLATASSSIYGSITLFSSLTLSGTGTLTMLGYNKTITVKSAGITFTQPISVNMTSGTFAIDGNLTTNLSFTLTNGTLDLTNNGAGNYTLSTPSFSSSNSNTRSITFGTGKITTTGSGTVWDTSLNTNFSYTGTPTVNISNNSGTATTVATGALTEAQALNFNYTIGTYTLTDTASVYKNLSFSGFTGTVPNSTRIIYGDLTLASGATNSAGANTTSFLATSGTQNVTTNGVTVDYPVTQNNPGATLKLIDNCTMGSTRTYTLTAGTLDLNTKTLTASTLTNTGTSTRAVTFNGGTITLSGSGSTVWNASGSGFTTSAGSGNGTISLTSASAKTFVGGGYTYAAALNQGGAGALTVTGSNTFSGLKNSTQPATITITASTTQTFTGPVTLAGTSGNLITLNSATAGTRFTFTYPTSTTASSLSYCSIIDCIGYQNAYWQAYQSNGCVNAGNNLGWVFNSLAYTAGGLQFGT